MKKLALCCLALAVQSCGPGFMNMDPPGSPEFKQGWHDGCESGLSTYAPAYYKLYYKFYQNYEMLSNHDYDVGWHESFNYCRHYELKWSSHDFTDN